MQRHLLPPLLEEGMNEIICIVEVQQNGYADIVKYEIVGDCPPRAWVVWAKDMADLDRTKNRFLRSVPHKLLTDIITWGRLEMEAMGTKLQRMYLSKKCYGCPETFSARISRLGKYETGGNREWLRPDYDGNVEEIYGNTYCARCLAMFRETGVGLCFCIKKVRINEMFFSKL